MYIGRQQRRCFAFVLDFSDAFWHIPIPPAEQTHFCATGFIDGHRKWIASQRAAQGSTAAPTLWGRLAALVMRLTQSLFEASKLRLVCYVDDPLAAVLGTEEERRMMTTLMVLIWAALGFKLAFSKGRAQPASMIWACSMCLVFGVILTPPPTIPFYARWFRPHRAGNGFCFYLYVAVTAVMWRVTVMVAMMMIAIAGVGGGYIDVDGDDGRDSDDDIGVACTYNGSLRLWPFVCPSEKFISAPLGFVDRPAIWHPRSFRWCPRRSRWCPIKSRGVPEALDGVPGALDGVPEGLDGSPEALVAVTEALRGRRRGLAEVAGSGRGRMGFVLCIWVTPVSIDASTDGSYRYSPLPCAQEMLDLF